MCRHQQAILAALLSVGLACALPVRAQVTTEQLEALKGRIVVIERKNGRWIEALILRVAPPDLVVQLEDGTTGTVPIQEIARLRLSGTADVPTLFRPPPPRPIRPDPPALPPHPAPRPSPRPAPAPAPALTTARSQAPRTPRERPRRSFYVEWIGFRTLLGGALPLERGWPGNPAYTPHYPMLAHMELVLFALQWPHFYWEVLRGGGGEPWLGHWGTAFGYPFRLDRLDRHQLRVGVHVTFVYGYMPSWSGLQVTYVHRPWSRFGVHFGVQQYSYPPGASFVFGFSS